MKDPSTAIRIAVTNAISGIVYNGVPVEVYDEIADPDASYPRIILQDVTGGGARDSKCGHGGDWTQVIKVSTAFAGRVTKNVSEDIAGQITEILAPSTGPFIDLSPDFNVWNTEALITSSQSYSDGTLYYVDRNIRLTYSLTEL